MESPEENVSNDMHMDESENNNKTNNKQQDVLPNQTLYIKNIDDKIKQDPLRKNLYALFTQYGKVLDIITSKARKLRGQAWIIYDDIASSTTALRSLHNTMFMGKPLHITYCTSKSDIIAQREGTYKPRDNKRKAELDKEKKQAQAKKAENNKIRKENAKKSITTPIVPMSQQIPHNILFVQDLPSSCNDLILSKLFEQFHGFKEVRMVGNKGLAFVEFSDEIQAGIALQGLYNFKLTATDLLKVSFAKK